MVLTFKFDSTTNQRLAKKLQHDHASLTCSILSRNVLWYEAHSTRRRYVKHALQLNMKEKRRKYIGKMVLQE